MKHSVRRGALIVAAVGVVVGCTSDINYRAYLPFPLAEGSHLMFRAREFGECSVEAFHISDSLAAELAVAGAAFFASPTAVVSTQPVKGSQVAYSPWRSGPMLDQSLPEQVRSKASWSLRCLSDYPGIQAAFEDALNSAGTAYFTYSTTSAIKPDIIVVLTSESAVIVAPY